MTIEKILQCSVTELEAMSDEQLKAHFEKYLPYTRPELIVKTDNVTGMKVKANNNQRGFSFNEKAHKKSLAEAIIFKTLGKVVKL